MKEAVKLSDIHFEHHLPDFSHSSSRQVLKKEIERASFYEHTLPKGSHLTLKANPDSISILFLCNGSITCATSPKVVTCTEKTLFIPAPDTSFQITASVNSFLLEIRWQLGKASVQELANRGISFPLIRTYADAPQYRDAFKSETTISRMILPSDIIPGFMMGSVEMAGDNLIGQHAHPLLDQVFFSFPETDMDLLIDCRICPMKGNTLLHIPLGSSHGVITRGKQRAHYLWFDFA